jgi:hypothetical protein
MFSPKEPKRGKRHHIQYGVDGEYRDFHDGSISQADERRMIGSDISERLFHESQRLRNEYLRLRDRDEGLYNYDPKNVPDPYRAERMARQIYMKNRNLGRFRPPPLEIPDYQYSGDPTRRTPPSNWGQMPSSYVRLPPKYPYDPGRDDYIKWWNRDVQELNTMIESSGGYVPESIYYRWLWEIDCCRNLPTIQKKPDPHAVLRDVIMNFMPETHTEKRRLIKWYNTTLAPKYHVNIIRDYGQGHYNDGPFKF